MNLTQNVELRIENTAITSVITKCEPLDYQAWVDFIEQRQNEFLWREETDEGRKALKNINNVPNAFKERVLKSLSKRICYKEFDPLKAQYNINITFDEDNNWIRIGFERKPKLQDLKVFIDMAASLNALLLKDGSEIIDRIDVEVS